MSNICSTSGFVVFLNSISVTYTIDTRIENLDLKLPTITWSPDAKTNNERKF